MKLFAPLKTTLALLLAVLVAGCVTTTEKKSSQRPPLRIGVAPDNPPMMFKQGDEIVGVEVDLAHAICTKLGVEPIFIELTFSRLIPSLMNGDIDMIMSGMSVTRARQVRIAFSEPYVQSGLMAMMRRRDAERFSSVESIKESSINVAVKPGTTGDAFVQNNLPKARRISYMSLADTAIELRTRRVDLVIHDGPAIAWLVSKNEAELTGLWELLTDEDIAWGIRRTDQNFLYSVNNALAEIKQDGTLDKVLDFWLPYRHQIKK